MLSVMNPATQLTDDELELINRGYPRKGKALLTGIAGARAHGLKTLSKISTVELTLPRGVRPPPRHQWKPGVHYLTSLASNNIFVGERNLRVTDPLQVLLHIQRQHGTLEALVAMDSARRKWSGYTRERLHELAAGFKDCAGIRQLRKTIDLSAPTMDSPLETLARYRLNEAKLPEVKTVEFQVEISFLHPHRGWQSYFVDQLINGYLVCELDGRSKYNGSYGVSTEYVLNAERERERMLMTAGFPVVRYFYETLLLDESGTCGYIRSVQQALRRYRTPKAPPPRSIRL